jgi:hypothetical protein
VAVIDLVLTGIWWAAVSMLLALRLTGVIDWSWWLVVAPLWLPPSITIVAFAAAAMLERAGRVQRKSPVSFS